MLLLVRARHLTLLGLQPRVQMEMTTGCSIDLEVLDNREVVLKFVNMEKTALSFTPCRTNRLAFCKVSVMTLTGLGEAVIMIFT